MLHEHERLEETQKPSAQGMPGPPNIPWAGGQMQTERLMRASHDGMHFSSLFHALAGIIHQLPRSIFYMTQSGCKFKADCMKANWNFICTCYSGAALSLPAPLIYVINTIDVNRESVYVTNVFMCVTPACFYFSKVLLLLLLHLYNLLHNNNKKKPHM